MIGPSYYPPQGYGMPYALPASLSLGAQQEPSQIAPPPLPVPTPMPPAAPMSPRMHTSSKEEYKETEGGEEVEEEEDWEPLKVQPYTGDMSVMGRLRAMAALEGYPPDDWGNWIRWTFASWARKSDIFGAFFSTDEELQSYSKLERLCVMLHVMMVALFAYRLLHSTTACAFVNTQGLVSDERGKQFYYWVPGLLVPVLRLVFLSWLIKLIFMKPMVYRDNEHETKLSAAAHALAAVVMIITAGIAGVMLFNGPPEGDPCGEWVAASYGASLDDFCPANQFHTPSYDNLGFWFICWLNSETIVQYFLYVLSLVIVQKYREFNNWPANRKDWKASLRLNTSQLAAQGNRLNFLAPIVGFGHHV